MPVSDRCYHVPTAPGQSMCTCEDNRMWLELAIEGMARHIVVNLEQRLQTHEPKILELKEKVMIPIEDDEGTVTIEDKDVMTEVLPSEEKEDPVAVASLNEEWYLRDLRSQALAHAVAQNGADTAAGVVARAEAYYAFLRGESTDA